ncbi:MAG: hypothetical protein ACRDYY_18515 [Acidimicrobiales bacterium]
MTDSEQTEASSNGPAQTSEPAPAATPISIPVIDFNTPTGDQMVEVRKGFGLGEVGGAGHASARDE